MSCALCEERREKRFCPAVHGKICPQCCGEQREVTLDCPSECPYLLQARQQARQQAREHASTHSHNHNERPGPLDRQVDGQAWFRDLEIPEIEISEHFLYEREELILGLSFALVKSVRAERSLAGHSLAGLSLADLSLADRPLMDRDLIAALSSLAKSYQTLVNSSLIYEPQTSNLAHQSIAREVETMVREFREAEEKQLGYNRLRDADVLKALVFLLRMGLARTSGRPKSRAFVDFLFAQFPEKQSAIAGPEDAGSRIVIP
ncbi:MAG TPA: hypothetical protein VK302_08205 [Terriglobales bacterium]|nr:hypothetical protein [Terriglobales bacterium]